MTENGTKGKSAEFIEAGDGLSPGSGRGSGKKGKTRGRLARFLGVVLAATLGVGIGAVVTPNAVKETEVYAEETEETRSKNKTQKNGCDAVTQGNPPAGYIEELKDDGSVYRGGNTRSAAGNENILDEDINDFATPLPYGDTFVDTSKLNWDNPDNFIIDIRDPHFVWISSNKVEDPNGTMTYGTGDDAKTYNIIDVPRKDKNENTSTSDPFNIGKKITFFNGGSETYIAYMGPINSYLEDIKSAASDTGRNLVIKAPEGDYLYSITYLNAVTLPDGTRGNLVLKMKRVEIEASFTVNADNKNGIYDKALIQIQGPNGLGVDIDQYDEDGNPINKYEDVAISAEKAKSIVDKANSYFKTAQFDESWEGEKTIRHAAGGIYDLDIEVVDSEMNPVNGTISYAARDMDFATHQNVWGRTVDGDDKYKYAEGLAVLAGSKSYALVPNYRHDGDGNTVKTGWVPVKPTTGVDENGNLPDGGAPLNVERIPETAVNNADGVRFSSKGILNIRDKDGTFDNVPFNKTQVAVLNGQGYTSGSAPIQDRDLSKYIHNNVKKLFYGKLKDAGFNNPATGKAMTSYTQVTAEMLYDYLGDASWRIERQDANGNAAGLPVFDTGFAVLLNATKSTLRWSGSRQSGAGINTSLFDSSIYTYVEPTRGTGGGIYIETYDMNNQCAPIMSEGTKTMARNSEITFTAVPEEGYRVGRVLIGDTNYGQGSDVSGLQNYTEYVIEGNDIKVNDQVVGTFAGDPLTDDQDRKTGTVTVDGFYYDLTGAKVDAGQFTFERNADGTVDITLPNLDNPMHVHVDFDTDYYFYKVWKDGLPTQLDMTAAPAGFYPTEVTIPVPTGATDDTGATITEMVTFHINGGEYTATDGFCAGTVFTLTPNNTIEYVLTDPVTGEEIIAIRPNVVLQGNEFVHIKREQTGVDEETGQPIIEETIDERYEVIVEERVADWDGSEAKSFTVDDTEEYTGYVTVVEKNDPNSPSPGNIVWKIKYPSEGVEALKWPALPTEKEPNDTNHNARNHNDRYYWFVTEEVPGWSTEGYDNTNVELPGKVDDKYEKSIWGADAVKDVEKANSLVHGNHEHEYAFMSVFENGGEITNVPSIVVRGVKEWQDDYNNDFSTRQDIWLHIDAKVTRTDGSTYEVSDILPAQKVAATATGNGLMKSWGEKKSYDTGVTTIKVVASVKKVPSAAKLQKDGSYYLKKTKTYYWVNELKGVDANGDKYEYSIRETLDREGKQSVVADDPDAGLLGYTSEDIADWQELSAARDENTKGLSGEDRYPIPGDTNGNTVARYTGTVENTYETTEFTVTKKWYDTKEDTDHTAEEIIGKLKLYDVNGEVDIAALQKYEFEVGTETEPKKEKGGEVSGDPESGKEITVTWKHLPRYVRKGGVLVPAAYYVVEDKIDDYATAYTNVDDSRTGDVNESEATDKAYNNGVITNTRLIKIDVVKIWDDADNQDGLRDDIEVTLFRNGLQYEPTVQSEENAATLSEGGADKSKTSFDDDTWTWEKVWTELPYADEFGTPYNYTAQETELPGGYESDDVDNQQITDVKWNDSKDTLIFKVTNTHDPEKISFTVTKIWDDADDQDGKRPENGAVTYTIKAQAEGEAAATALELPGGAKISQGDDDVTSKFANGSITINTEDGETITVTDLDKYAKAGKEITYTIEETGITDYTTAITGDQTSGFTVTNSYEPETVDITVNKVWDDADNRDGKRPDALTFRLFADDADTGKTAEIAVADKDAADPNKWTKTDAFKDLPKYKNGGTEIVYTVKEETSIALANAGYTKDESAGNAAGGYTIKNSYTPATGSIIVNKIWDDNNDQDGKRPDNIKVTLKSDDATPLSTELTFSGNGNEWSSEEQKDLPVYKTGKVGEKVTYTIEETKVEGYDDPAYDPANIQLEEGGTAAAELTVTNKHTPETADIYVQKVWDDANDQDRVRPGSVMFKLAEILDGKTVELGQSKELDKYGNWTAAFKNLDVYRDGNKIVYTIIEAMQDVLGKLGYTASDVSGTGSASDPFTITNTREPEKVTIKATKVWDDQDDKYEIRKDAVFTLIADGEPVDGSVKTISKNASDAERTVEWTVDKYKNGSEIRYTVTEDDVQPYSQVTTGDMVNGFIITNTYPPVTETKTVTRTITYKYVDESGNEASTTVTQTVNLQRVPEEISLDGSTVKWSKWEITDDKPAIDAVGSPEIEGWTADRNVPEWVIDLSDPKDAWERVYYTPDPPVGTPDETWGGKGESQTGEPEFEVTTKTAKDGSENKIVKIELLDENGNPTDTVTVDEGTYVLNDDGTITFTPNDPDYTGDPTLVYVRGTDKNGKTAETTYTPHVVDNIETEEVTRTITYEYNDGTKVKDTNGAPVVKTETLKFTRTGTVDPETGTVTYKEDGSDWKAVTTDTFGKVVSPTEDDPEDAFNLEGWVPDRDVDEQTVKATDEDIFEKVIYDPEDPAGTPDETWGLKDQPQTGTPGFDVTTEKMPDGSDNEIVDVKLIDPQTGMPTDAKTVDAVDKDGNKVGTYTLSGNGTVTFTPEKDFVGDPEPLELQGTDKLGGTAETTYTPHVVDPEDTGEATRTIHYTYLTEDGEQVTDDTVQTVTLKKHAKEIDPKTGDVTEWGDWEPATFPAVENPDDKATKNDKYWTTDDAVNERKVSEPGDYGTEYVVYTYETVDITAKKVWDDNDDQDGKRPKNVVFNLVIDNVVSEITKILNKDNNWTATFEALDRYKNGEEIAYTVVEALKDDLAAAGYTADESKGDKDGGYTITNKRDPDKVTVKATKVWDDGDNRDDSRPGMVTFTLYADGKQVDGSEKNISKTASGDALTVTWSDLDKNAAGEEIDYTVAEGDLTELKAAGYTTDISDKSIVDGVISYTVTNTRPLDTVDVEATKVWNDEDNQDGKRPESVTFVVYADGQPTSNTKTVTEGMVKFENLPKNREGETGEEIVYTVKEEQSAELTAAGYTTSVSGTAADGFTITNSYIPEMGDATGDETWGLRGENQTGTPDYNKNPNNPVTPEKLVKPDVEGATISDDGKTVTIPGEGTYTLNDDGTVTFDPEDDFTGDPTPVSVSGKDKQGNEVTVAYIPHVVDNEESETVKRTVEYVYQTPDGSESPVLDEDGKPIVKEQEVTFKRTAAALDPDTHEPIFGEWAVDSGVDNTDDTLNAIDNPDEEAGEGWTTEDKAEEKKVAPTDPDSSEKVVYTPAPPAGTPDETWGRKGESQTGKPEFEVTTKTTPNGSPNEMTSFTLVDKDGNENSTVKVPGEGTYTIDSRTGEVTFTPEPDFTGDASGVTVKGTDKNGLSATATYTPHVVDNEETEVKRKIEYKYIDENGEEASATVEQSVKLTRTPKTIDENGNVTEWNDWEITDDSSNKTVDSPEIEGWNPDKTSVPPMDIDLTKEDPGDGIKDELVIYTPEAPLGTSDETWGGKGESQTGIPEFKVTTPTTPDSSENEIVDIKLVDPDTGELTDTVTVDEGTYVLNDNGTITFTPKDPEYVGDPTPVEVVCTDKNNQTSEPTTYTPHVVDNVETEEVTRTITYEYNDGTKVKDANGNPVEKTETLKFTRTGIVDPDTGKVTYKEDGSDWKADTTDKFDKVVSPTEDKPGEATNLDNWSPDRDVDEKTVKATDDDIHEKVIYNPKGIKPTADETYGLKGQEQTGEPEFEPETKTLPDGTPNEITERKLIDPSTGEPADGDSVTIAGQGTYKLNEDGTITFKPEPDFVGNPTPVGVTGTDKLGNTAKTTYTPHVVDPEDTGEATRTIHYTYLTEDGVEVTDDTIQTVTLKRHAKAIDPETGEVTEWDDWEPATFPAIEEYPDDEAGYGWSTEDEVGELTVKFPSTSQGSQEDPDSAYDSTKKEFSVDDEYVIYKPEPPVAEPDETYGLKGEPQTGTPIFSVTTEKTPEGEDNVFVKIELLDDKGEPAEKVTVSGEGTYEIEKDKDGNPTGNIIFTPEPDFTGDPAPVKVRATDSLDGTAETTYTPHVIEPEGETTEVTRTIHYRYNDKNGDVASDDVKQTVTLERTPKDVQRDDKGNVVLDDNGKPVVTEWNDWTTDEKFAEVISPDKTSTGWNVDKEKVGEEDVTFDDDGNPVDAEDVYVIYTPVKTDVHVEKIWDDRDDQDGARPASVIFNLVVDSVARATVELSEENQWKHTFEDLNAYENGKKVVYTITEGMQSVLKKLGYTVGDVNGTGSEDDPFTITNTKTPEQVTIKATKVWNDQGNKYNIRKDAEFTLNADGLAVEGSLKTIDKNASEAERTVEWTVDKYKNGKEIRYTVTEADVSPYSQATEGDMVNGFIITNTYPPVTETKEVTRTITYKYFDENGKEASDTVIQTVNLQRVPDVIDEAGGVVKWSDWEITDDEPETDEVSSPDKPGWYADRDVPEWEIDLKDPQNAFEEVYYTPDKPVGIPDETYGGKGKSQTGKPEFEVITPDTPDGSENEIADIKLVDPDTGEQTDTVTVDEGTYVLNDNGTITFTPKDPEYVGDPTPVEVVCTDKNNQTSEPTTYTPHVVDNVETEEVTRTITYEYNDGTKVKDANGNPVEKTETLKFTRTGIVDPDTGKVTYKEDGSDWKADTTDKFDKVVSPTEDKPGEATNLDNWSPDRDVDEKTVKATDDDIHEKVIYNPKGIKPTADETYGLKGQEQTGEPEFEPETKTLPDGTPNEITERKLIDPSTGEPADGDSVTIAGQGTYKLNEDGTITFKPEPDFVGNPTPVGVTGTDKLGNTAKTTYTPHVVDPEDTGEATRTIHYTYLTEDGVEVTDDTIQTVTLKRHAKAIDPETGEVTEWDDWEPATFPAIEEYPDDEAGYGWSTEDEVGELTVKFPSTSQGSQEDPDSAYDSTKKEFSVDDEYVIYKPEPPVAEPDETYGLKGEPQTGTPIFSVTTEKTPEGEDNVFVKIELLDDKGEPAEKVTVSGEGTYEIEKDKDGNPTGNIIFTPEPDFTGDPAPVKVRATDSLDGTAETTYTPHVVDPVDEDEATRTIHYTYLTEDGAKVTDDTVQTVTLTRKAKAVDPETGVVTEWGDWEPDTFPSVENPDDKATKDGRTWETDDKVEELEVTEPGKADDEYVVYTPVTIDITAKKVWDDNDNQDGKRPNNVVFNLVIDNVVSEITKILNKDNDWTATFEALDKYKDGKEISYTVIEALKDDLKAAGYTADESKGNKDGDYTITNIKTPEQVTIRATKVWDDQNDKYGIRKDAKFTLMAEDVAVGEKTIAKDAAGDDLTVEWTVDKYKNGSEIRYTVIEADVRPYSQDTTGDMVNGFIITNTYPPEIETKKVTRTITYKYIDENGNEASETVTQTVNLERVPNVINEAGGVVEWSDWMITDADPATDAVKSPDIDEWTADRDVPEWEIDLEDPKDAWERVYYTPDAPVGTPDETYGGKGESQTGKPEFEVTTKTTKDGSENKIVKTELLDKDGNPADIVEVPEGTYTLNPDGTITFTPNDPEYTGDPTPVNVRGTDKNGKTADTTYTPHVVDNTDTVKRTITYEYSDGTPVLGDDGEPLVKEEEVTFTGTVDPKTGEVTFPDDEKSFPEADSPDKDGWTPDQDPVEEDKVKAGDDDITRVVVYNPDDLTADPDETYGLKGEPQTGTPVFTQETPTKPDGTDNMLTVKLIDPSTGEDTDTVTFDGQGTYKLNPDGTITFTPEDGYVGNPTPVGVRGTDEYGKTARTTYTPHVVDPEDKGEATRTIHYTYLTEDGTEVTDDTEQKVTLTRKAKAVDPKTGDVTEWGDWEPAEFPPVENPDDKAGEGWSTDDKADRLEVTKPGKADDEYVVYQPEKPVATPMFTKDGQFDSADQDGNTPNTQSVNVKDSFKPGTPKMPDGSDNTFTFTLDVPKDEDGNPVPGATVSPDGKKVTVPGEGTYELDPDTGDITFTPDPEFTGKTSGVTVNGTDKFGNTAETTYTPIVVPNKETAELVREVEYTYWDEDGNELSATKTETITFTRVGEYDPGKDDHPEEYGTDEDKDDQKTITYPDWTPKTSEAPANPEEEGWHPDSRPEDITGLTPDNAKDKGFEEEKDPAGNPTGRLVRRDEVAYTPDPPVGGKKESYGFPGVPQSRPAKDMFTITTPTTDEKTPNEIVEIKLKGIDPDTGEEVESNGPVNAYGTDPETGERTVVGVYTYDPATGRVIFTPNDKFSAAEADPEPVTLIGTDKNGLSAESYYQPHFRPKYERKPIERNIDYVYDNGDGTTNPVLDEAGEPLKVTQTVRFQREAVSVDEETGDLVWGDWTPETASMPGVKSPTEGDPAGGTGKKATKLEGWVPDKDAEGVTGLTYESGNPDDITVVYKRGPVVEPPVGSDKETYGLRGEPQSDTPKFTPGTGKITGYSLNDPDPDNPNKKTVPGEGVYELDPGTGKVTFTPEPDFVGDAAGVTVTATDENGLTAEGKYTPHVVDPYEKGKAKRTITYIYDDGTPVLDDEGNPLTEVQEEIFIRSAKTIDPKTGDVTEWNEWEDGTFAEVPSPDVSGYTPNKDKVKEDTAKQGDDKHEVVVYKKAETPENPQPPKGSDKETYGGRGQEQSDTPEFTKGTGKIPEKGAYSLEDPDKDNPLTKTIPGEGKYTLDPDTGKVTFKPEPDFIGDGTGVTVKVTDENGLTATGKYTPHVVDNVQEATATKTIRYYYDNGDPVLDEKGEPRTSEQKVTFARTGTVDPKTGKITGWNEWTKSSFEDVNSPDVDGYNPNKDVVEGEEAKPGDRIRDVVIYSRNIIETTETKTIKHTVKYRYLTRDGEEAFADVTQVLTFSRVKTENVTTGEVSYSDWIPANDTTEDVKSPVLDNYNVDVTNVEGRTFDPKVYEDGAEITEYVIYTPKTIWVTYVDPDGTTIYLEKTTEPKAAKGAKQDEPEAPKDPEKAGYEFKGWDRKTDEDGNITYTAKWEPVKKVYDEAVTVARKIHYRYLDKDGKEVAEDHIDSVIFTRKAIVEGETTTYTDWEPMKYTFGAVDSPRVDGWIPDQPQIPEQTVYPDGTNEELWVIYTPSTETMTLERTIFYTYYTEDGDEVTVPVKQTLILCRDITISEDGKDRVYGAWYIQEDAGKVDIPVVDGFKPNMSEIPPFEVDLNDPKNPGDVRVVYNPETYWVTYVDPDGKTIYLEKTTQNKGEAEPKAPVDPKKDGYVFGGWDRSVDKDGNVTYTAIWTPAGEPVPETYWVTYVDPDGKTIYLAKTTQNKGEAEPKAPVDPKKDGYVFKGWNRSEDEKGNVTYTAIWEPADPTKPADPTDPTKSAGEQGDSRTVTPPASSGRTGNNIVTGGRSVAVVTPAKADSPGTGDRNNTLIWVVAAVAAAGAGITAVVVRRRKRGE